MSADFQQQAELEAERYETTVQALERCLKAGAKPEDVETLAKECGITTWKPTERKVQ